MNDLRIRRDRSALSNGLMFGQKRRSRLRRWHLWLWLLAMAGVGIVIWQFNHVQPVVLKLVGISSTPTPTGPEYAHRGDLAFIRGNLDDAVLNYGEATKQTPTDLGVLYELTRILIYRSYDSRHSADAQEAVKWATKAVEANPNNTRAEAINCFALSNAGHDEDAIRFCTHALASSDPQDPITGDIHAYLATAYLGEGNYKAAADEADTGLKLNLNGLDTNTIYGLIASYQPKTYEAALQAFDNATKVNPRLEFPWFNLGNMARTMAIRDNSPQLFDTAVKAYNSILTLNTNNVKAYVRLCQTYLTFGRPNSARDTCKTATLIDPSYTDAWAELGEVLYRSEDYTGAVTAFKNCTDREQSVAVKNRQTRCWYYQGLALALTGDCKRALPIFTDLLSWVSNDAHAIDLSNKGIGLCEGNPLPTARP